MGEGCQHLLARNNLDIPHMLAEGFTKEHKVNLSPFFARGLGDQVIESLFETGFANGRIAGHGKLQYIDNDCRKRV